MESPDDNGITSDYNTESRMEFMPNYRYKVSSGNSGNIFFSHQNTILHNKKFI